MKSPHFQIGDRVRVIRTGPDHRIVGVVREVDTRTLGAQTNRGPRYRIEVNGLPYGWLHELDLSPETQSIREAQGLASPQPR
jgi:hypothetical protein